MTTEKLYTMFVSFHGDEYAMLGKGGEVVKATLETLDEDLIDLMDAENLILDVRENYSAQITKSSFDDKGDYVPGVWEDRQRNIILCVPQQQMKHVFFIIREAE